MTEKLVSRGAQGGQSKYGADTWEVVRFQPEAKPGDREAWGTPRVGQAALFLGVSSLSPAAGISLPLIPTGFSHSIREHSQESEAEPDWVHSKGGFWLSLCACLVTKNV